MEIRINSNNDYLLIPTVDYRLKSDPEKGFSNVYVMDDEISIFINFSHKKVLGDNALVTRYSEYVDTLGAVLFIPLSMLEELDNHQILKDTLVDYFEDRYGDKDDTCYFPCYLVKNLQSAKLDYIAFDENDAVSVLREDYDYDKEYLYEGIREEFDDVDLDLEIHIDIDGDNFQELTREDLVKMKLM